MMEGFISIHLLLLRLCERIESSQILHNANFFNGDLSVSFVLFLYITKQ